MMELLKIVPALVLQFPDMQLVNPDNYKVTNAWVEDTRIAVEDVRVYSYYCSMGKG